MHPKECDGLNARSRVWHRARGEAAPSPGGAGREALTWTWLGHACPAVGVGQPGGCRLPLSPASSLCPPVRASTGWEGRPRPLLGPCFLAVPLWDVGTVIAACGQLEVLFNLKGSSEPKGAEMWGAGICL